MKQFVLVCLITLVLSLSTNTVPASDVPSGEKTAAGSSAEAVVAQMSDEQARHLLIEELKKEAAKESATAVKENGGTIGGFIETVKNIVGLIHERVDYIKSGGRSNRQELEGIFAYLNERDPDSFPTRAIFSVLILFMAAYAVELIFRWYTAPLRSRIHTDTMDLRGKIGRQLLMAGTDVIATLIFIAAVIVCRYLFFEPRPALHILVAAYLSAIVGVRMVLIIARFLLSPKDPGSRFFPITEPNALFLYRWIIAISIVTSFGLITGGVINLSGVSEAAYIKAVLTVDFIIAAMLFAMIFQKRQEVADALSANFTAESQMAKLMQKWHHFGIFFIFILLTMSAINLLLGNAGGYTGIKALLMIPLYFLSDWILRRILDVLFGFIPKIEYQASKKVPLKEDEEEDQEENQEEIQEEVQEEIQEEVQEEVSGEPDKLLIAKRIEFDRAKKIIVSGLRTALVALFIVWIFNIWGIELPIGKAVAKAVFNILIVVLLCYIVWEFVNAAIKRRLHLEIPEDDEEMEEGGAGGSRIGTLLVLLRKFLMVFMLVIAVLVILSAMGVNIGPLIAGAGVFGLAIGFGAQTLVKDIIAGIFFLMDDAFRVGDYIEVGGAKGMVERISIRSLSLRHPRGMVNTLPFGDISSVTNYSRDYIITKLDFRVRYDTDVEKVRKIIKKKVYEVILKDEKLGPKLTGKLKSQGVRQLDDSAMVMRVKYKTKPGEQFAIRKEVYRLLQEAFKEAGIEFAHKNVTVFIPPDVSQSPDLKNKEYRQKVLEAAAAAAISEEEQPKEE